MSAMAQVGGPNWGGCRGRLMVTQQWLVPLGQSQVCWGPRGPGNEVWGPSVGWIAGSARWW